MSSSKEHVMSYIYDTFKRSFNLVEADTLELRNIVYRLRYEVFCEKYGFLDASKYPDKMEKDEFDQRSCHMLIQFVPTQEYVGAVRLILPDSIDCTRTFPIEENTQINGNGFTEKMNRKQTAEISRFLVSSKFNRRTEDKNINEVQPPQQNGSELTVSSTRDSDNREKLTGRDRRSGLSIYMVLMAAVLRMSWTHRIEYWWCAMDPALNRLLGFSGLNFVPIGPVVDYHGLRQPFYKQIKEMLDGLRKENYGVWEIMTDCGRYNYNEVMNEAWNKHKLLLF